MKLDDLISWFGNEITKTGIDANSPGEMVRASLAGQMPGMAPRSPMSLSGAPVAPVQRSAMPPVTASAPSMPPMNVGAAPAPAPVAAPSAIPQPSGFEDFMAGAAGNDLLSGLIGGFVNTSIAPEKRKREAALKAQQDQQALAQQNQTVQFLVTKRNMDPVQASMIARDPEALRKVLMPEQEKPTDDMREYQAAKQGGFPGTFMDYQQALRKSGATSINMAGDKAWEVERAKLGAKKLADLSDSANMTSQVVDQMETMQQALDAYNKGSIFGSGNIAPYEVQMRGFLKGLGVGNADTLAGGELARSVQNQMALLVRNPESGMGMPGALSDADRQFLVQTMPGIDKSPQGNTIMIAVAKKAAQRKMEIAALAEQYAAQNGGMEGFQGALKQWAEAHPMLDDALKAQIAAAKGVPAADAGPPRVGPNPRAGFITPANAATEQPTVRKFNPATGRIE